MQADRQARWYVRVQNDPAALARRAARERERRLAIKASPARAREQAERAAERQRARRGSDRRAEPFAGSVAAAGAPSEARDLLSTLAQLVPRHPEREEIVAEAALLVLEGEGPADAIREARRRISQQAFSRGGRVSYSEDEHGHLEIGG